MSSSNKRQLSKNCVVPESSAMSGTTARKKRKVVDTVSSDEDDRAVWTPKHLGDLRAYNRSASEAPAELFRKDLISAMKLADNEPLTPDDYWGIVDQWKQEWERGVQVPVNPDVLPEPCVKDIFNYARYEGEFRLYIRINHNEFFNNEVHILSNLPTKAEKMCRYDMDILDDKWLNVYNGERARMGAAPVPSCIFEAIVEHLEETCWENIHKILKDDEPSSIEYDDDVICDVCRTPESEEGNAMVFCDMCDICVHQACYGIITIPSGPWLCRTCSLGIKPDCVLCPNKGGAMKSTKSGKKWAHVSCALWIPEVNIASVERMEPITKIQTIPQSRWALVCVLCRQRRGACIQCSVKVCNTAYHVTCAFKHSLDMKPIIVDENAENGVKLKSYCVKHSRMYTKDGDKERENDESTKKKKDMTSEQKNQARAAKLRQIETEFCKHVDVMHTSNYLNIDFETTETIFYYWKLKRKAGFNKPLLTPRRQEIDFLSHQQEQDIERMKMFVQLRQYLERVRNLCYMVSRREKMTRSYMKSREQTFHKQANMLSRKELLLNQQELDAVLKANHGPSLYDRLYSQANADLCTPKQFVKLLSLITGAQSEESRVIKKDINGLIKSKKTNPYSKVYINGAERRRSRSSSLLGSSASDSDSHLSITKWTLPPSNLHASIYTTSEDELNMPVLNSIKNSGKSSRYCTSDEDVNLSKQKPSPRGRRGRGKRGVGRGKLCSSKDRDSQPSDTDRTSKNFDSLLLNKPLNSNLSYHSKIASDTSDNESCKSNKIDTSPNLPPVRKGKVPTFSSDEETVKSSPRKKGTRGRGRPPKVKNVQPLTPKGTTVSHSSKLDSLDASDDELPPPMYKLTSDEDESDHSLVLDDPTTCLTSYKKDNDEEEKQPRKSRRCKAENIVSESETENADVKDAINHIVPKTKAAMKEFTPKLELKAEKIGHKKTENTSRNEKHKVEAYSSDNNLSVKADSESTPDISLLVPQRAAAKKASELITSHNTGSVEPLDAKRSCRSTKDIKEETELHEEHKVSPSKSKKGRPCKDKNDGSEASEVKKSIFDSPEILPYVPMRQAAKKAAENLKVSGSKTSQDESVENNSSSKSRKLVRSEHKSTRLKSPRKGHLLESGAANKEFASSSKQVEDADIKQRSLFSDSEDETFSTTKKSSKCKSLSESAEVKAGQQLFRGDIYGREVQSSSEDEDTRQTKTQTDQSKTHGRLQKQRGGVLSTSPKRKDENKEPAAETQRKAPDKKLKTSDGRPEHGFRPPLIQRNDSRVGGKLPSPRGRSTLESGLHPGGIDCRPRTPVRDEYKGSVKSDIDDTPRRKRSGNSERREGELAVEKEKVPDSKSITKEGGIQSEESPKLKARPYFKETFKEIEPIQQTTKPEEVKVLKDVSMEYGIYNFVDDERKEILSDIDTKKLNSESEEEKCIVDRKVEQPRDSGYKSAITTPEPLDKGNIVPSDMNRNSSHILSEVSKSTAESESNKFLFNNVHNANGTMKNDLPDKQELSLKENSAELTSAAAPVASCIDSKPEDCKPDWLKTSPSSTPCKVNVETTISSPVSSMPEVCVPPLPLLNLQQSTFTDSYVKGFDVHDSCYLYPKMSLAAYYSQLRHQPFLPQDPNAISQAILGQREIEQHLLVYAANSQEEGGRRQEELPLSDMDKAPLTPEIPVFTKTVECQNLKETADTHSEHVLADSFQFDSSLENEKLIETTKSPLQSPVCVQIDPESNLKENTAASHELSVVEKNLIKSPELIDNSLIIPVDSADRVSTDINYSKLPSPLTKENILDTMEFSKTIDTSPEKSLLSPCSVKENEEESTLIRKSLSPSKRVPVYVQDRLTKTPEKKSPRSQAASPRWSSKTPSKSKERRTGKSSRGAYSQKSGRGRGSNRYKARNSPKCNAVSVPKALIGTPYDFDDDMDDGGPVNNTLDDLRMMREKRQTGDVFHLSSPSSQAEVKESPKKVKERKQKVPRKVKKEEEYDEVQKMLEDYRNQQNTTLKRSVHEPSPPQENLDVGSYKIHNYSPVDTKRNSLESDINPLFTSSVASNDKNTSLSTQKKTPPSISEDGINQLKLKIKGPYANSYIGGGNHNSSSTSAPDSSHTMPNPPNPITSTLRRMRKKELIQQYCYQDMNPEPSDSLNAPSTPPQLRTSITIPKAIASMTSIPTKEDYKMYTQDDSSTTTRRKRQTRELKNLDLSVLKDSECKRNTGDSRKRRGCKDVTLSEDKDVSSARPPPKLRISFGKKGRGVTTVPFGIDYDGKGKPPKKRIPEANNFEKLKNDCLKYREELMADFEKTASPKKANDHAKKGRKRRLNHDGSGSSSDSDRKEADSDQHRVIADEASNKLVIRRLVKGNGIKSDSDSAPPLKLKLSLTSLGKSIEESDPLNGTSKDDSSYLPFSPIKLKFSRCPDGYVACKTSQSIPLDHGHNEANFRVHLDEDDPSNPTREKPLSSSPKHSTRVLPIFAVKDEPPISTSPGPPGGVTGREAWESFSPQATTPPEVALERMEADLPPSQGCGQSEIVCTSTDGVSDGR